MQQEFYQTNLNFGQLSFATQYEVQYLSQIANFIFFIIQQPTKIHLDWYAHDSLRGSIVKIVSHFLSYALQPCTIIGRSFKHH